MIRNPVDRLISNFYFCQQERSGCAREVKRNTTIIDWAKEVGSVFFKQLLLHRGSCQKPPFKNNNLFVQILAGAGTGRDVPGPGPGPTQQDATQRTAILNYFMDNLENWFAVIGITEEFYISLQAFEKVFALPFTKFSGKAINTGAIKKTIEKSRLAAVRLEVENSPVAMEALYEDRMLYAKAREIFEKQKESLLN